MSSSEPSEKSPILPSYFKADMADSGRGDAKKSKKNKFCCVGLIVIVILLIAAIIAMAVTLGVVLSKSSSESLVDSIQSDLLQEGLTKLQDTSIDNSRSVLNGYNQSAEYICDTLRGNGYEPVEQYFTVPVFENLRPGEAVFKVQVQAGDNSFDFSFIESSQFNVMTYSGACETEQNCNGLLIDQTSGDYNYGCNSGWSATDQIVLMTFNSSKGCSLYQKASMAKQVGARAVIFERDDGDTAGPPASRVYELNENGEAITVDIPAIGVSNAVGQQLKTFLSIGTVTPTILTYTTVTYALTYNVLAYTVTGSNESVIVVGSHLDSVPAGPGINDNGSGSIANLQLAIQLGRLDIALKNQIMFAWWGAEELGLFGSTYYVAQLTEHEKSGIALNLNFDMIASPNFQRGVYNGSSAAESINAASTTIQDTLVEYFTQNDLTYEIVPFTGRSDYGPFIEADIPAGGLFTGAEQLKTQEQYNLFGGTINAPLDPCYHKFCDTIENIDLDVFEEMTKSAAYTVEKFASQDNLREYLENGG